MEPRPPCLQFCVHNIRIHLWLFWPWLGQNQLRKALDGHSFVPGSPSPSVFVNNIRAGEAQRKGEGEPGNEARLKCEVTFDDFP